MVGLSASWSVICLTSNSWVIAVSSDHGENGEGEAHGWGNTHSTSTMNKEQDVGGIRGGHEEESQVLESSILGYIGEEKQDGDRFRVEHGGQSEAKQELV